MACSQPATSEVVAPKAFHEQLTTQSDVVLLDVRTDGEYKSGHIEGALNCNVNGADFKKQVEILDKDKTVYLYCGSGVRSARAAKELKGMGFKRIVDLSGGIQAWQAAGLNITH
jgi:rhodanese-related sulfurtransferase